MQCKTTISGTRREFIANAHYRHIAPQEKTSCDNWAYVKAPAHIKACPAIKRALIQANAYNGLVIALNKALFLCLIAQYPYNSDPHWIIGIDTRQWGAANYYGRVPI